MANVLFLTLRGFGFVAGLVLLIPAWQSMLGELLALGGDGSGFLILILKLTAICAAALVPIALVVFAVRPRWWRVALLPVAWAIVATIIVDPRHFDFLF